MDVLDHVAERDHVEAPAADDVGIELALHDVESRLPCDARGAGVGLDPGRRPAQLGHARHELPVPAPDVQQRPPPRRRRREVADVVARDAPLAGDQGDHRPPEGARRREGVPVARVRVPVAQPALEPGPVVAVQRVDVGVVAAVEAADGLPRRTLGDERRAARAAAVEAPAPRGPRLQAVLQAGHEDVDVTRAADRAPVDGLEVLRGPLVFADRGRHPRDPSVRRSRAVARVSPEAAPGGAPARLAPRRSRSARWPARRRAPRRPRRRSGAGARRARRAAAGTPRGWGRPGAGRAARAPRPAVPRTRPRPRD